MLFSICCDQVLLWSKEHRVLGAKVAELGVSQDPDGMQGDRTYFRGTAVPGNTFCVTATGHFFKAILKHMKV